MMIENHSPKVAVARGIGKKFKKDQVIIFMLDRQKDTIEYVSYGKTKALCADAKQLADLIFETIFEI